MYAQHEIEAGLNLDRMVRMKKLTGEFLAALRKEFTQLDGSNIGEFAHNSACIEECVDEMLNAPWHHNYDIFPALLYEKLPSCW